MNISFSKSVPFLDGATALISSVLLERSTRRIIQIGICYENVEYFVPFETLWEQTEGIFALRMKSQELENTPALRDLVALRGSTLVEAVDGHLGIIKAVVAADGLLRGLLIASKFRAGDTPIPASYIDSLQSCCIYLHADRHHFDAGKTRELFSVV